LRIIAGQAGGRTLVAPKGMNTRPTADRIKEAVFSVLAEHIIDAEILDAFAGSGALGLEALSRGAASAVFIDKDRAAAAAVETNIAALGFTNAKLYVGNAQQMLKKLKAADKITGFDIVFLDPPYNRGLLNGMLETIRAQCLLKQNGIVVVETTAKDSEMQLSADWWIMRRRVYGDTEIIYCGLIRDQGEEDDYGQ